MTALLAAGPDALAAAARAAEDAPTLPLGGVRFEAPVLRPPKIFGVGLNYADHVAESGMETPKLPLVFNKRSTSVRLHSFVPSVKTAAVPAATP